MRFTPADVPPEHHLSPSLLPPAKWPVHFVIVANRAGRSRWLDIHKLQTIFVPALRQLCATPDQHIELLTIFISKQNFFPARAGLRC